MAISCGLPTAKFAVSGSFSSVAYAPLKKRRKGAMDSRSASARRTAVTAIAAWYYQRHGRRVWDVVRVELRLGPTGAVPSRDRIARDAFPWTGHARSGF